jgi:hypothetical protein
MAKDATATIWVKETEFISGLSFRVGREGLIVLAGFPQVLSPQFRRVSFLFTHPQG